MPLLETRELTAFYGDFQALFGITLSVEERETIAIIGANGAGKSTFLKTVAGLLPSKRGSIHFNGKDIGGALDPNSTAALMIWENAWAEKFAKSLRNANGILIANGRIPATVIEELMAASVS